MSAGEENPVNLLQFPPLATTVNKRTKDLRGTDTMALNLFSRFSEKHKTNQPPGQVPFFSFFVPRTKRQISPRPPDIPYIRQPSLSHSFHRSYHLDIASSCLSLTMSSPNLPPHRSHATGETQHPLRMNPTYAGDKTNTTATEQALTAHSTFLNPDQAASSNSAERTRGNNSVVAPEPPSSAQDPSASQYYLNPRDIGVPSLNPPQSDVHGSPGKKSNPLKHTRAALTGLVQFTKKATRSQAWRDLRPRRRSNSQIAAFMPSIESGQTQSTTVPSRPAEGFRSGAKDFLRSLRRRGPLRL